MTRFRPVAFIAMTALIASLLSLQSVPAQAPAQNPQPPAAASGKPDPSKAPVAQWIWGTDAPRTNQEAYFRSAIELPAGVAIKSAVLWTTCDNECEVFVNGNRAALNKAWETPATVDVAKSLKPGVNTLSAMGKNHSGVAAFILKLRVELADGKVVEAATGEHWKTSHDVIQGWWGPGYDESTWKPAKVVGPYGRGPWGDVANAAPKAGGTGVVRGGSKTGATPAEDLVLLPGFKAELVYSVPKAEQGSWVSMCLDHKGRLIVSDQGGPLYRVTPGKGQDDTKVEKIDLPIGHAQGLLWAFDGLYVVVNGGGIGGNGGGMYRLEYDAAKDAFTSVTRLAKFSSRSGGGAGGEHGPHAVRLGPDGKLYVIGGNFTRIPDGCSPNSPARNWAEDLLNVRNPDGGGHDPTIWAPAGWVARCDKDGKNWELVLTGLRNAYDFDFNRDGDYFIYDSDMEWDTGSPWYRPTRLVMGVEGGEYGWRNGTGKWPDYYPDSLPTVANMGLGSPTGVQFGYGAKFPAKYQNALYCMDWAYGKLYAVHLTPSGAGYRSTFEPFVQGRAWDGTDLVIGNDGAMYVTIGGRGTQSGLYRITYAGTESTALAATTPADPAVAEARKLARLLPTYGGDSWDALDITWRTLSSPDRYLRFAAGRAMERMPLDKWQDRALSEQKPTAAINGVIALIRAATADQAGKPDQADKTNVPLFMQPTPGLKQEVGTKPAPATPQLGELRGKVLAKLNALPIASLSDEQRLELLRAYQLAFIRLGRPTPEEASAVLARLEPLFPGPSANVNRELGHLLSYLDAPSFAERAVALLAKSPTQEEQLHFALCLRVVKSGWTPERRKAYFGWLDHAEKNLRGGNSFRRFIARIRTDALEPLSPTDQEMIAAHVATLQKPGAVEKPPTPRQFVRNWQMADLVSDLPQVAKGRDFEKGKAAYDAAQCAKCHRFGNEGGGGIGPDLTGVGARFQPADILEAILLPSAVISDQYQTTEIKTKDDDLVVGHVAAEDAESVTVVTDPFNAAANVVVKKTNIQLRRAGRLSLMPEGTVDTLTKDEILDLIAYLRAGGNNKDAAFGK